MNSDGNLVASASSDCTCLIFSIKDNKIFKTLQFAEHEDSQNLRFIGCKFSKSGDVLFTASCDQYSYLTQWDMETFLPITTYRIHAAPVKVFNISLDGFYLGIGTNDGWVKIINTRTMDFEKDSEDFARQVSALSFTYESRHLVVCSGSEMKNIFNTRKEGAFSKVAKILMITLLLVWIYLSLKS